MAYIKYSKDESKEQINKIVEQFDIDFGGKENPHMKEAQLEEKYIKPFFSYLNWNIHNEKIAKGREEFRVQTSHRMNKTIKEPDYELWLPEKETQKMKRYLFMEAKDPKYDLKKEVGYMRQAYQYAHSTLNLSDHSTNRTRLSLLTDFEEFRLFDCFDPHPLTTNEAAAFNKYIVSPFDFNYTEYESNFNIIWDAFERDNVYNGSLNEFKVTDEELKKNRIAPDLKFLDDLKKWSLDFARSMYKSNKEVSDEFLTSASQLLINRIIFIKMLTDRDIEEDFLTKILGKLNKDKEEISIYDSCRDIFQNLDKRYNGDIFKRRDEFDFVKIENKIFKQVIESLRPEKSVYTLAAMPIEIIGNAYEQFLGEVIVHKGRGLTSEQKPEVQKAGGVYYTPRYIVDYIIQNTVGEKLKECKKPDDVENIKILDPACGSGSFLIGAYDCLLKWYLNYYKTEVDKMLKKGKNENEIKKKLRDSINFYSINSDEESNRYIIHLTSKIKKQILLNNINGVDIDGNAVEITKFSLSMKSLENSTKEEIYEDVDLFNEKLLPELKDNIKCGNSLVSSDIFGLSVDLSHHDNKTLNTFDWDSNGEKIDNNIVGRGFPEILNNGGFDCVVGNPPYVRIQTTNANDLKYFSERYVSATKNYDIYCLFVERGIKLLKENGIFAYILPHRFLKNDYGIGLRKYLANNKYVKEIIDFDGFMVFNASINTCILTAKKLSSNTVEYYKIIKYNELPENVDTLITTKKGNIYKCINQNNFNDTPWYFVDKGEQQLWDTLNNTEKKLKDVTLSIFQGIKTGADTVFILDYVTENNMFITAKSKALNANVELEKNLIYKLIKSGNMKPYHITKSKKIVIFPYKDGKLLAINEIKKNSPKVFGYLSNNKKILEKRDKGKLKGSKWYGYSRSQALNVMWQSKLLTPDYFSESCFCYDENGGFFFTGGGAGGYGIIPNKDLSYLYLMALLNSKIVNWYHQKISLRAYQTAYLYSKNYIQYLPIMIAENKIQKNVETLIKDIIQQYSITDSHISANEKQIALKKINNAKIKINNVLYSVYNIENKHREIIEQYFS